MRSESDRLSENLKALYSQLGNDIYQGSTPQTDLENEPGMQMCTPVWLCFIKCGIEKY